MNHCEPGTMKPAAKPEAGCCATRRQRLPSRGRRRKTGESCCAAPTRRHRPAATTSGPPPGTAAVKPRAPRLFSLDLYSGRGSRLPGGAIFRHDDSALGIFTGGIFELFNQMWWGIAIGVIFVGILGRVPRNWSWACWGVTAASPACSGHPRRRIPGPVVPRHPGGGHELYERGASVGQVMAFLLASPWNSFPSP